MNILYLISIILGVSLQNAFKKAYIEKTNGRGVYTFSVLSVLVAVVFFIITSKGFEWNHGLIIYVLLFGFSFTAATAFTIFAVASGPLSVTALIVSYSSLCPTLYGIIFLKDSISFGFVPGIILLIISLFLINGKNSGEPFTLKWIIYVTLAFAGNGMCSVVQKMQQVAFDGMYKNEFMMFSLIIVAVILGAIALKNERKEMCTFIKAGCVPSLVCGFSNGMVNLFVMILSGLMPVSVMFPLLSAGGIIVTYIISKLWYKETLSKLQFVGFVAGIGSVVFLNI